MKQRASRRVTIGFGLVLTGMMLFSSVASMLAFPAAVIAAEATTNSDVNLRSGPSQSYEVLTVVPQGGAITIDGDAVDGFAPASYNGVSGWLSVGFVVAAGTAPVSAYDTQTTPAGVVTSANGDENVYSSDSGTSNSRRDRNRNRNSNEPATVTTSEGTTTSTTGTTSPEGAIANPGAASGTEQDIVSIIHEAAASYGQSPSDMERVARCESNLNPRAVDPSGSYHGLFQFVPNTFAGTPYGDQDIYDPWANAHAAAWMWSQGRKGEWVCQ